MKEIRSPLDLAVNGARPAFRTPLHVGRPNIGTRESFLTYANSIYDSHLLTNNGPLVQELERRIQDRLGVRHCIAMCNGTIALEIAVRALGLTGEVIVPSYTFIATAHALHWQAITPVFADIDPNTHNLDPSAVERMITPRTSGIIGVHLWGRASPVDQLQELASRYDLKLMFDAAHAFGCQHAGTSIGNFGACEVLSFHATKIFNTFEGGAVVTNDDALAEAIRLMRNFGFQGYDNVIYPGTNGKLTEICAAMGLVNLESLDEFIETNRLRYEAYVQELERIEGLSVLRYIESDAPNYQYVVVEVHDQFPISRDEIVRILQAENILARKYFWPGCHRMQPYRDLYPHAGMLLINTEVVAKRVIVLPTGKELPEEAITFVGSLFRALQQLQK